MAHNVYALSSQVMYNGLPVNDTKNVYHMSVQVMYEAGGEFDFRLYSFAAQIMYQPLDGLSVYSLQSQVLYKPQEKARMYAAVAQILFRADAAPDGGYINIGRTDVEEEDVIYHDIIFPECITYGSTTLPRYQTEKAEVQSGSEQRNTRWAYPKHEYSINMENMPADEYSTILNIWHIVKGDYAGFLFLDPIDHTSSNTAASVSGSTIENTDQLVALAVGSQAEYPLYKEYQAGSRIVRRRILFPKADTLIVAIDGFSTAQWEFDLSTNVLRFLQHYASTSLNVTKSGNVITRSSGSFIADGVRVGDLLRHSGWTNVANNALGDPTRVVAVTNTELTLQAYDEGSWGGAGDEASSISVTFTHALPPTDAEITAGFTFYVPVRFDDSDSGVTEIIAGMRETQFANMGDIKLKEIFE